MPTTPPPRTEPKPLIVIVEDEAELADLIAQHLEKAGMKTQVCNRAAHAAKFLKKNFRQPHPPRHHAAPTNPASGSWRNSRPPTFSVPVIFLTGNIEEMSKVRGSTWAATTT